MLYVSEAIKNTNFLQEHIAFKYFVVFFGKQNMLNKS